MLLSIHEREMFYIQKGYFLCYNVTYQIWKILNNVVITESQIFVNGINVAKDLIGNL